MDMTSQASEESGTEKGKTKRKKKKQPAAAASSRSGSDLDESAAEESAAAASKPLKAATEAASNVVSPHLYTICVFLPVCVSSTICLVSHKSVAFCSCCVAAAGDEPPEFDSEEFEREWWAKTLSTLLPTQTFKEEDMPAILASDEWKSQRGVSGKYAAVTSSIEDDLLRAMGIAVGEANKKRKAWNLQHAAQRLGAAGASSSSAAAAGEKKKEKPKTVSVAKVLAEGSKWLDAAKKADKNLSEEDAERVSPQHSMQRTALRYRVD